MTMRKLRPSQDWSRGFLNALTLPDGAFKLYVWLRLNARLDDGVIETSQLDLARALKKSPGTIRANLKILERANVCRMKFVRNPNIRGTVQLTDDYWPYERVEPNSEDPELRHYIDRIRGVLEARLCVRSPLSAADELLVRDWHARGVSFEKIQHAVLLGCGRKYASWRNGAPRLTINSLAYFEPLLAELEQQTAPDEYWEYARQRIERMEKLWHKNERSEDCA